EGTHLSASDPDAVKAATGVDAVFDLVDLPEYLAVHPTLFVPLRPGEGAQASWNTVSAARAGRLAARGVVEAMRATRPGAYEYQLEAACRSAYLDHGAMDVSYRAVAAGGANAWYYHYLANDAPLRDGDLVLFDCGPHLAYYASDVTR